MALIDEVKAVCDRLAPLGWRDRLLLVTGNTLDISQSTNTKLKTALTAVLPGIDRTQRGFEDFHPTANQAVAGGSPAQSLLYHALASSSVHPTTDGGPSADPKHYPTLDELEVIENFIFSLVFDRTDLVGTIVAVFAYQYREASRTPHLRHADVAYSRTGVARVGTVAHHYDRSRRGFWVIPEGGGDALAVLPARYGVFLARRSKPGAAGSVQGGHSGANDDDFVFPVHKLFAGRECLKGQNLAVSFLEFHRNEKLRKTHRLAEAEGGLLPPSGFDITQFPYVRDSSNGGNLATLQAVGSSVLLVPKHASKLVRTVSQANSVTGTNQLVHFIVPATRVVRQRSTRFLDSTLEIPFFRESDGGAGGNSGRLAPEYVSIRHQVNPTGPVTQTPTDLNALKEPVFAKAMKDGGYAAAHFTDDSCDGCVEAVVVGLTAPVENLPAFSLITAPDFYPLGDQFEVETDPTIQNVDPLSRGRLPVNPTLPLPSNPTSFAFNRLDKTYTAVVGGVASGPPASIAGHPNRLVSFLPDGASNVFAPGWDTSQSFDALGQFLTSSGLGSPFPEDAKLCAALASFWPAVAPDNGRTFGNEGFGNQLPMLDAELGFHPNHERVKSGELRSYSGWDGEFGPFFEKVGAKTFVNFVAIERSDYVSQALAGRIRVNLTAEVQSEDLIARHQALEKCQRVLVLPTNARVCLVVVRGVDDWATAGRGAPQLIGGGFLMEFAELAGTRRTTSELNRVQREVKKRHVCQFGTNGVAYKNGNAAFVFRPS
jgi:hypothetical protein